MGNLQEEGFATPSGDIAPGEGQEIESILEIVDKAGTTDVLTQQEMVDYSNYVDSHYTSTDPNDHNANLAEHITDNSWMHRLANDVIEWVDNDKNSRKDWEKKEARGLRVMGVSDKTVGGGQFKGASKVVHPLMIEACVQFQARAISEMWPPSGPVQPVVLGEASDEAQAQADRVAGFMNYQYTTLMPGAFEEEDKMLLRLPMSGSCFKKTVYDAIEGTLVSRFIESSIFYVPFAATSLQSAVRYTEKYEETGNETARKIAAGVYRKDVKLYDSRTDISEDTLVETEIDSIDGREYVEYEGDHPYIRYECYCHLDVPGFEDVDEKGEKTGVALPYCVTVDLDNQVILALRRGWRRGDLKKRRRVLYNHYKFLPGLGFYGLGLFHTIGGLAESATGALRSLLDAAGFANTKGGYRSRDAKITGGDESVGMGQWIEVDSTADELKQAFFPLPYDEPSKTLFELLGMLDDLGRRFASTTENMVGEASNNGPVGTTLALIEQGSKVFSGIHLRLHKAHAEEYKLLAELNPEYMPDYYPYKVPGEEQYIKKADFDERVDVIPVSDPNIISNTQRIATAQGVLELSQARPDLYDAKVANRGMLQAMRVANILELMPEPEEIPPSDPVTEMSMLIRGEPVKAFVEQDHEAHMTVHEAVFMTLSEDEQERLEATHVTHMAEHKAFDVKLQFEELIGGPITPENQDQATQAAAQAAQIFVSENGVTEPTESGEESRKDAETLASIKRGDMETVARIKRQDDEAMATVERKAMTQIAEDLEEAETVGQIIDDIPGG